MKALKQALPFVLIPLALAILLKLGKGWFGPSFRWWFLGVALVAFAAAYLHYRRSMASLAQETEHLDSSAQAKDLGSAQSGVVSHLQEPPSVKAVR